MSSSKRFEAIEVRFNSDCQDPSIVLYGVLDTGQLSLLRTIDVGPFPDWEALARVVMAAVIDAGRRVM